MGPCKPLSRSILPERPIAYSGRGTTAVHRSHPDSSDVAGATLDTAGRSALREASHSVNLTMEDPALIAAIRPDMLTSHHRERIRRRYSPRHRRRLCLR
jgi:hypothetical protein